MTEGTVPAAMTGARTLFDLPVTASPDTEEPARLIVGRTLPEFLCHGLLVIQEVDSGSRRVRIDLVDSAYRVVGSHILRLAIPTWAAAR